MRYEAEESKKREGDLLRLDFKTAKRRGFLNRADSAAAGNWKDALRLS